MNEPCPTCRGAPIRGHDCSMALCPDCFGEAPKPKRLSYEDVRQEEHIRTISAVHQLRITCWQLKACVRAWQAWDRAAAVLGLPAVDMESPEFRNAERLHEQALRLTREATENRKEGV